MDDHIISLDLDSLIRVSKGFFQKLSAFIAGGDVS